uniref:Uncharacterized protein n=1 Tax=Avena sativa TaxID=4498 RepID=A0ACD5Y502_AVESA
MVSGILSHAIHVRSEYPEYPVPCFQVTEGFDFKKAEEFMLEWDVKVSKSIANDIIIPDPAPKKIFLDTIRLLAKNTNNLLKELWNYIEDGKIIQSAVLLLAAQEQIRGGCSSKINGSRKKNGFRTKINGSSKKNGFDSVKKNGFDIINKCVVRLSFP